jgi:uncharacterized lipoprotein YmbA
VSRAHLLLPLLCLAAACGSSPPVRFYTLSDVSGERLSAAPGAVALRVDRIRLPGELDRSQLVSRVDANRLEVFATSRWAAPLDEMIRRVLSADLAARLPEGLVVDPNQPVPLGQARFLTVNVHEFYGEPSCAVNLRAAWLLMQPRGAALQATEDVHVAPAGKCPEALAATMSQALAQLSDRIALAVTRSHT